MEKTNQTNIVLGADDAYALPLAVTVCSILKNVPPQAVLHLFILDGGITEKNKRRLQRVFEKNGEKHLLTFIQPDLSPIRDLPSNGKPPSVYLPLLIPELLPEHCKRAIFLDCDLILETDITKMEHEAKEQAILWAIRDVLIQTLSDPKGVSNYKNYGGNADSPYFNSGVMLIDLELWREENVTEQAIRYIEDTGDTMYHCDQEALNAILINKWQELNPRWNQQGCIYWPEVLPETEFTKDILKDYDQLLKEPFIIHYLSPSKPWSYRCMHPEARKFLFYLKESHWFSKAGWKIWWCRFYLRRFLWLFSDLRTVLNQINFKKPGKKARGVPTPS
ncbi:MAG: glycosyltransferase family 8 protein [Balneolaceae bacterium]